jgi:hypothetical protein
MVSSSRFLGPLAAVRRPGTRWGVTGLEPRWVATQHAVVVARVACFSLMKKWSGTTPFAGIFPLLLMLDADSISTCILF